ncbi:hypothetical protein BU17DRAFT_55151 [Hysterangium stoloniferum]|nr:hypothetical protein BU17DRAFT_55151 [Hysterangium stoloniferum]
MTVSLEDQVSLPTLKKLRVEKPENVNPYQVAAIWLNEFSQAVASGKSDAVTRLILDDGFWRDMLALTWDFRTIRGTPSIRNLLEARLAVAKITNVRLSDDRDKQPSIFDADGIFWIQSFFDFETSTGTCSGIFRIVPTANGPWKAHTIYTNLEVLKGSPYKVGPNRSGESNHGQWVEQRSREIAFKDSDPKVVIIGGGQSGLDVAVRLKYQGVDSLVVERHPHIGDNWRTRYKALCLHDPVWYDHMPYLNFPLTWPVFTPAVKLADWLESYAHTMELNVWTSTEAQKVERDDDKDEWIVTLIKSDGSKRVMRPKYVVFAFGVAGNQPNMPQIPGMDKFEGKITHSLFHKEAADHLGKKVVVVGACTAAHDISQDFQRNGVDVTMVQRSSTCVISVQAVAALLEGLYSETGPPVDIADRINASFPNYVMKAMHTIAMASRVKEMDRATIEELNKVGFKTNYGPDDSGFFIMAWERAGGYYLDVGASQLIIDGKIKIKNGSIKTFTTDSLVFEDGSTLKADVVVFATGLGDARVAAAHLLEEKLVSKIGPIWGLNEEGELNGLFRNCGVPNLYFMMGNLAICRFNSTHIALQIKAKETGLYTSVYDG